MQQAERKGFKIRTLDLLSEQPFEGTPNLKTKPLAKAEVDGLSAADS